MSGAADNGSMRNRPIEPGLLRIFTWYVGIRLAIGVLALLATGDQDPTNPRFPGAGVFWFGLLFALLLVPGARRRLGRWFLPVALALATIGPIAESAANISGRLNAGLSPNDALVDYWIPFFLLWVPLLIVAWQYRYRAVIVWAGLTTFLDLALTIAPLEETNADLTVVSALVLARGLLFAFVGLFVVKLVKEQKEARRALADHAATQEELATSRERNRLARELHDTLAHSLSAVTVQLEAVKALWDTDQEKARRMLDQSLEGARSGLGEARRAIGALRASPLEEWGLAGALDHLGAAVQARSSLDVAVDVDDDVGHLDPAVEQAVYRIADEALTNSLRHSGARRVGVRLERDGRRVLLEVHDDGTGFDPNGPIPDGHLGLQGMRERAELVGGSFALASAPGTGTTISFAVETVS